MEQSELIEAINDLKVKKDAVILAHNYQRPEIYKIADYIGDSLELSRIASLLNSRIIVFCGVRFMAETAKVLNPCKKVLLPEENAGCSLADTIGAEDVGKLRRKYPGCEIVAYINTSAEVKSECDICCTSSNALDIVNSCVSERVIFLPDENLGKYIQSKTNKNLILWKGHCDIHHFLEAEQIREFKKNNPDVRIITHPECRTDLLSLADYVSSTGKMKYYAENDPSREFLIITECGMVNKLAEELPEKKFYSYCRICPFMKMTSLESVLSALSEERHEIFLREDIIDRAKLPIMRMLDIN